MRFALICLPAAQATPPLLVAGRSLGRAQLEFALRCGCDSIVLHGQGASREAVELRHQAEAKGAKFCTIGSAQALVGLVSEVDSLLVLQPGLWPEAAVAEEGLLAQHTILTLAAGAALREGFERIDLDRGWAGALALPGSLVSALDALPEDIEPTSALLRIALQGRLPELRIQASLIDEGGWNLVLTPEQALAQERRWIGRVLDAPGRSALSESFAKAVLHKVGGRLAASSRSVPLLGGGLALLLAVSLAACWHGFPAVGFAILAPAWAVACMLRGLGQLRSAPRALSRLWSLPRYLIDGALTLCAMIAIGGLWYRAVFVAVVLLVGILLINQKRLIDKALFLQDRGLFAVILAIACALLLPEAGLMLAGTALLLANLATSSRQ